VPSPGPQKVKCPSAHLPPRGGIDLPKAPASPYKRAVPRVLIPSDNQDFARYLAQAYQRAGWEAAVGTGNFDLATAQYDLVHFQWPEELCQWLPPSDARLEEMLARVDAWRQTTRLAMTVHNLEPHRDVGNANYRRLYEAFIPRMHLLAHFTETSRDAMLRAFPASRSAKQIVTGYFSLNHLRNPHASAATLREAAGFTSEDFVLLVFGGLREWDEVQLLMRGFDAAQVSRKRLLMAGRYDEPGPIWQQRFRRWNFRRWLHTRGAKIVTGYIPDDAVHRIVEPADALVLPRFRALNSGLPALAATFGKTIIVPRCGAYPELFEGTQNPVYTPGDARDLAQAIENAVHLDRATAAAENTRLAALWSWDTIVQRIVTTLAR